MLVWHPTLQDAQHDVLAVLTYFRPSAVIGDRLTSDWGSQLALRMRAVTKSNRMSVQVPSYMRHKSDSPFTSAHREED